MNVAVDTLVRKKVTQRPNRIVLCIPLLLLVGCARQTPSAIDHTTIPQEPRATQAEEPMSTPRLTPDNRDLDLREANVLAVEFEELGGGEFRFNVTMIHDDTGEAPEFADWWQVEDPQGNMLGRRELLHGHGSEAFTRAEIIAIPANIKTVIVRGHDIRHGYGGQSMRVDMISAATTPFNEGNDPSP